MSEPWEIVNPVDDERLAVGRDYQDAVGRARQAAALVAGCDPIVLALVPDEEDEDWADLCVPYPCPRQLAGAWQDGDVVVSLHRLVPGEETEDALPLVATCPLCADTRQLPAGTLFEVCGLHGCGGMLVPDPGPATRQRDREIVAAQARRDGLA